VVLATLEGSLVGADAVGVGASSAGADEGTVAICGGAVSIGGGTDAVGAEAMGAVVIGAGTEAGAAAVVFAGALGAGAAACLEVLVLAGATVATFFGGSVALAGAAGCGRDSTGALGAAGAVEASATVVAEVLPFVVESATVVSDFAGVALALGAVADLSVK